MSLRNRISVAAALLVLIVVAAVSSVLYLSYASSLESRRDANLIEAAQQASGLAARVKQAGAASRTAPDFTTPIAVGSVDVQLLPGPVTAGQATAFGPLSASDLAVAAQTAPAYLSTVRQGGRQIRIYTAALPGVHGGLVRTGRAIDADNGALSRAALLLSALTVLAAALIYGTARLTAGRVLRPIADLTIATEQIARTGDLSSHLDANGARDDEVGRLATSFATMLSALHTSQTAQRRLVADASHELRTPLTSLTTNLELLEEGAGVADAQAPGLVRSAREQAGELNRLITDLLDLARFQESVPHRETVRLDRLTAEAVERMRRRWPDTVVTTDLQPCLVYADPAGIDRAISNLVDNAVKWSPAAGTVEVAVADGRVRVTDHGPGIAEDDLPRIFERFYRAPTAQSTPGAGLGLAIVGSIAHVNDGTVQVETGLDGSTFILTLADAPPPPEASM